jgi:citrate synthase
MATYQLEEVVTLRESGIAQAPHRVGDLAKVSFQKA